MPKAPKGIPREHPNAASSHMGDRCVAATSLRCCGGTPGDQDDRGTNELSKIESILGTRMSQNLSRDRRLAWGGSRCRCPRVRYVADFRTSLHAHPLENREEWCYQRGIQGRRGWLDDSRSPQLSAGTHGKTKPSATKKANPGRLTLWYWWWMGLPLQTLAPEKDEDALLGIRCPPWRVKRRRVVPGSREATRDTRRVEGAQGSIRTRRPVIWETGV